MGADRATTGTDAGLDGGSATAGAANPSNAASSAAGEQLCNQLIEFSSAYMCLARQLGPCPLPGTALIMLLPCLCSFLH